MTNKAGNLMEQKWLYKLLWLTSQIARTESGIKTKMKSTITFHQECDEQQGTQMDVCTEGR